METTNLLFNPNCELLRPRGCLYIFYEKEFQDLHKPVYKIGFTSRNSRDRLKEYQYGTKIIYEHYLALTPPNLQDIETEIKRKFRTKFIPYSGSTERFEGDIVEMRTYFIEIITEMTKDKNVSYSKDEIYISPKISEFKNDKMIKMLEIISQMTSTMTDIDIKEWEEFYENRKKVCYQYDDKLYKNTTNSDQ